MITQVDRNAPPPVPPIVVSLTTYLLMSKLNIYKHC